MPACVLIGLEPDEIDVAVETDTGGLSAADLDDETGMDTGNSESATGDGDPGGDGDPAGDGDPTGTGDGDPTTGDGDGDPGVDLPCALATEVELGANDVTILDGPDLLGSECGAPGPESLYSFTAPAEGVYTFTLSNEDFTGAVYLVDEFCEPIDGTCAVTPAAESQLLMTQDMIVFIAVDSNAGGGTATLDITQL